MEAAGTSETSVHLYWLQAVTNPDWHRLPGNYVITRYKNTAMEISARKATRLFNSVTQLLL
jgi:hypothetical protein